MEWFYENRVRLSIIYINLLLIFYVFSVCFNISGMEYYSITAVYLIPVVIYWLISNKIRRLRYRISIIIAAVIVISIYVYGSVTSPNSYLMKYITENLSTINTEIVDGYVTNFSEYVPLVFLLTFIIVTVTLFLYEKGIKNSIIIVTLAQLLFFWYMQYYNEIGKCMYLYTLVSAITYIANNYESVLKSSKNGKENIRISKYILFVYVIIISFIVAFPGTLLPQQHLTNLYFKLYNEYSGRSSLAGGAVDNSYDISSSGYNDSKKELGGPISINYDIAMRVKADKAYYLKGSVKNEYTGHSWIEGKDNYKPINSSGFVENEAVQNISSDEIMEKKKLEIDPVGLRSTSFMTPIYSDRVEGENISALYDSGLGTFINSKYISRKYSVSFYDINPSSYATTQYGVFYLNNNQYGRYLQVPKTVTQRTVELVYNLVKDCNSVGDKVTKIRNYLSNNYKYTLNASYLPKDKDFVDYFLFEDKKGYCVHFATAMTMMYRIAGIPARFVEGYKMNESTKKNGIYTVTNAQAHAWCEYMVKDGLWAISDASPTPLEVEKKKKELQAINNKKKITKKANNKIDQSGKQNEIQNVNTNKNKTVKKDKIHNRAINIKPILISLLILAVISSASLAVIYNSKRRKSILFSESCLPLYRYMLKVLARQKITKEASTTDMEFINKLEAELQDIIKPLAEAAYGEFYGGSRQAGLDKEQTYSDFHKWIKNYKSRKKSRFRLVK